jgi:hypothetical protein
MRKEEHSHMSATMNFARGLSLLALAAAVVFSPVANAGLSDVVLSISASNSRATGTVEIHQSDGWWDGDTFYWETTTAIPIEDPQGNTIGTFGPAAITSYVDPSHSGRANPQINLGFAMQAGNATTSFSVTSGLLTVSPAFVNPDGRAAVGITVNDANGDGATLVGLGNGAMLTQYNGGIPNGTTFAELVNQIVVPDPFGQQQGSGDTGWVMINDTVSSMNSQIHFTLTAGDSASGTSSFQVVPEPSGLLMLVAGLALWRRR